MKTEVEIQSSIDHSQLRKGEKGYIDGYINVQFGPYAVVVVGEKIDLIPLYALRVITPKQ